jgi:hypothetical protein
MLIPNFALPTAEGMGVPGLARLDDSRYILPRMPPPREWVRFSVSPFRPEQCLIPEHSLADIHRPLEMSQFNPAVFTGNTMAIELVAVHAHIPGTTAHHSL